MNLVILGTGGLVKEEESRKCYMYVAGRQHHKIHLERKGFQISKKKPFLGASVDNIRSCKCSPDCGITVVEYKCPWVHRNSDQKKLVKLLLEIHTIYRISQNTIIKYRCDFLLFVPSFVTLLSGRRKAFISYPFHLNHHSSVQFALILRSSG